MILFRFTYEEIDRFLPSCRPGIHFVLIDRSRNAERLYIGKAVDLRGRLVSYWNGFPGTRFMSLLDKVWAEANVSSLDFLDRGAEGVEKGKALNREMLSKYFLGVRFCDRRDHDLEEAKAIHRWLPRFNVSGVVR